MSKDALYDEALIKLHQQGVTNITNSNITKTSITEKNLTDDTLAETDLADLDKRFNLLKKKISSNLDSSKINLAQFVGIKIELDYLKIQGYNQSKVDNLWVAFRGLFSVKEPDYRGLSLNDRYYSINRTIERIGSKEEELTVTKYLELEQSINQLEKDQYLEQRVSSLRSLFLKLVFSEIESAILNYEPLSFEEQEIIEDSTQEAEKNKTEEVGSQLDESLQLEESEEELKDKEDLKEPQGPQTKVVHLIDGGFAVSSIRINLNDTVQWLNAREGRYKMAFIVGNRNCQEVKSKFFGSGESFNWTFIKPGTCWISDGIFTTQAMSVIVT
ncbi:hypothetical protein HYX12_02540 [Candidatus Woesearchaeota archaeon]|nr:hypothetical protein [Candidatus Woesearchaeota archaeon]